MQEKQMPRQLHNQIYILDKCQTLDTRLEALQVLGELQVLLLLHLLMVVESMVKVLS